MRELTRTVSQDLASPPASPAKQAVTPWYKRGTDTVKLQVVSALVSDDTQEAIGQLQRINVQLGKIQKQILRLDPDDTNGHQMLEAQLASLELEQKETRERVKEGKKALETSKRLGAEIESSIQRLKQLETQKAELAETSAATIEREMQNQEKEKTRLQRRGSVKQMRWWVARFSSSAVSTALINWKLQVQECEVDKRIEAEQNAGRVTAAEISSLTVKLNEAEGKLSEAEERAARCAIALRPTTHGPVFT